MNYIVWCEDYGQKKRDGRKVNANNAETAACLWAEWYDRRNADYSIANSGGTIVTTKKIGGVEVKRYSVGAEAVPSYYANEVANGQNTEKAGERT